MLRTMMKSKIHRATVTQADLHYVGSVTVDEDLLDAADLLPGELVHIVDVTNGARLETYTIAGRARLRRASGINGAAAHLVHPGDLVILIAYAPARRRRGAAPSSRRWCSWTPTTGCVGAGRRPGGGTRPGPGPRRRGRGGSIGLAVVTLPQRLAAPSPGWTTHADVVVVGSGIAGLTAALQLRRGRHA